MAIEISAQFTKFTQFAADSIANGEKGADTIARLDAEDPLGGRTITTKTGDWIGKWARSDDLKETNDRVRALFRQTVADLATMLAEGARDWFARVPAINDQVLDEAVMGKGGGEPTEDFKNLIRHNMERMSRSGFEMMHSTLGFLLGDVKELPDDYKAGIPVNYKMIVEDYAQDTRRQFDDGPKV